MASGVLCWAPLCWVGFQALGRIRVRRSCLGRKTKTTHGDAARFDSRVPPWAQVRLCWVPVPPSGPAGFGALPHNVWVHLDTQGDLRRPQVCDNAGTCWELPASVAPEEPGMFGIAFSPGYSSLHPVPRSLPVLRDCRSRPARRGHAGTEVTSPREAALPPQQPLRPHPASSRCRRALSLPLPRRHLPADFLLGWRIFPFSLPLR